MSAIYRWCVPDGIYSTRADRAALLVDELAAYAWAARQIVARMRADMAGLVR